MQKVHISLGNVSNAAEVLLNRMVESKMKIPEMVSLVSGVIHSCDTGMPLDYEDKMTLKELGYRSAALVEEYIDYCAMQSLMNYLDEELPGILQLEN